MRECSYYVLCPTFNRRYCLMNHGVCTILKPWECMLCKISDPCGDHIDGDCDYQYCLYWRSEQRGLCCPVDRMIRLWLSYFLVVTLRSHLIESFINFSIPNIWISLRYIWVKAVLVKLLAPYGTVRVCGSRGYRSGHSVVTSNWIVQPTNQRNVKGIFLIFLFFDSIQSFS